MGALTFAVVIVLGGCSSDIEGDPSSRDGGTRRDAGPGGFDAGPVVREDGGEGALDAELVGRGAIRPEICGNDFDDDDNGMIDDGCDCAVGTSRACWLGPPDSRGVGICHDGTQRCESSGASSSWTYCEMQVTPVREILFNGFDDDCDGTVDEPDGICAASAQSEMGTTCGNGVDDDCDTQLDCDDPDCAGEGICPGGCDPGETLCWGEVDDDCDGDVDCADSQCAMNPSCVTGPCPRGQTPTYRERSLPTHWGGSSVSRGDGQPTMPMTCEPGLCPEGQVAVVLDGRAPICVPPPPMCPMGTHPNYVASGTWRCDPPCAYIVHYGSIYGGRTVCAGPPDLSCPSGQVPTFVYETERWECRRECDNTLYDRIYVDGLLVCVPC